VSRDGSPAEEDLRDLQDQLQVLARVHIDPRLQGKIDLSDIVNETLGEACKDWKTLEPRVRAQRRGWLRRAFLNNLRDAIRRLRSRGALAERSLEAALERSSVRLDGWLAADDSTPSQKAARQEEAELVVTALSRLPERERMAVILQRWHGWKLDEIAGQLGCTPGAVAGLIHRGLDRLRKELQQMGVDHA
jgi:RNA polymerase sigma-70 factor (ECF subfamily)